MNERDESRQAEHGWFHDHLAAYVMGGLAGEERERFEGHMHGCAGCFEAFAEARDADLAMQRALSPVAAAAGNEGLEERVVAGLRRKWMPGRWMVRRAGYGVAAAVALAATGVLANYAIHRESVLNNAISEQLAEASAADAPQLDVVGMMARKWAGEGETSSRVMAPASLRGIGQSSAVYANGNGSGLVQQHSLGMETDRKGLPGQAVAMGDGHVDLPRLEKGTGLNMYGRVASAGSLEVPSAPADASNQPGSARVANIKESTAKQVGALIQDGEKMASASQLKESADLLRQELDNSEHLIPYSDLKAPASAAVVQIGQLALGPATAPAEGATGAATQPGAGAEAIGSAEVSAPKIIRNGTVEFEVRSFDEAAATVAAVAAEERGFVASTSSERLANGKMRGTIVLRVPPERMDRLLLKLRGIGELKSQQIGSADVSKQYTDLESELRGLRTMEGRLLELIKNGHGEVKELVEAEKQLGEYRVRIEKIEGEIRYYNNLVAMATLTVTAYEKDIQKPAAAVEQETINVALETEEVEAQYAAARKAIEEAGGRIVESQLKNTDAEHVAATITADLPPEKAEFVAGQLRQLGRVAAYTRDRRQTTSGGRGGGSGAGNGGGATQDGGMKVEQKEARVVVSLFNLANLSPRETVNLTVAVRDVDAAYRGVMAFLTPPTPTPPTAGAAGTQPATTGGGGGREAKSAARVISSSLSGQEGGGATGEVRAELRAEMAEEMVRRVVAAAGGGGGGGGAAEVLSTSVSQNTDPASTTAAKRGLQLRLVNVATVPARETQNLRLVAADVNDAYGKLMRSLEALADGGTARLISSHLEQSDPRNISGAMSFEVRRSAMPAVEKAFSDAGVEILGRTVNRAPASANALDSKVAFQVDQLLSASSLPPRRTYAMTVQVEQVDKALEALRGGIDGAGGKARELDFSVSRSPAGETVAQVTVETSTGQTPVLLEQVRGLGVSRSDEVTQNAQVPETRFARDRVRVTLAGKEAIVAADRGIGRTVRAALSSAAAALLYSAYLVLTGILFLAPFALVAWPAWRLARRRRAV